MAGGILNGSGVYGPAALENNPSSTIVIPTMLQISADIIDTFTHLTCIYNRYWYNRADMMTFPICFFYVKKITPTIQVETSEQRVILYEPQLATADAIAAKLADPIRPGVQEVVVDNMVRKPKTYQMEIIVPFQPVSKQMVRTTREFQQILEGFGDIFGDGGPANARIASIFSAVVPYLETAGKMVDIATKFPLNNAANYINMNSLEAMADSQKILTMKMWTGYDYKYVIITGLTWDKDGKEDDVFRATLQLKEMPVLTVTPVSDVQDPTAIDRNWAAKAVSTTQELLLAIPLALTGVKQASGE